MSDANRLPPHNIDAERSLLGCVLINPDAYAEVCDIIRSDGKDFYLVRNKWVWEAVAKIKESGGTPDIITVTTELDRQRRLSEIGGPIAVSQLMDAVPSAVRALEYAQIVEESATRRRLIGAASNIAELAWQEDEPIANVIDQSEESVLHVGENRRVGGDLEHIGDIVTSYHDNLMKRLARDDKLDGIGTGIHPLDNLLGGLGDTNLHILAGRPGMGKTSLMLEMALRMARDGRRVTIFSIEMTKAQIMGRMASMMSGVNSTNLRSGTLLQDEIVAVNQACGALAKLPIWIDDESFTPSEIRSRLRRNQSRHGLDVAMIDYLQLMSAYRQFHNDTARVTYLCSQLVTIAKHDIGVPIIALAQLSRAVEQRNDKRPMLSDLRESGSIEQDASTVTFVYRDKYYNKSDEPHDITELIVSKNRYGNTGVVKLVFKGANTRFLTLAEMGLAERRLNDIV